MPTRVFVEDNDPLIKDMFLDEGYEVVEHHTQANLICFGGGADVSPELYFEENTHSLTSPKRDLYNVSLALYAQNNNIPCVGICRGAQFLNVWKGGTTIQDMEGHRNTSHEMRIRRSFGHFTMGDRILVNSDHHQSMKHGYDASIMGFSDGKPFLEAVLYKETAPAVFCYQPHPEWVGKSHPCRRFFFEALKHFVI